MTLGEPSITIGGVEDGVGGRDGGLQTERYVRGGGGVQARLSFFSLLYCMLAPSSESQILEAWPAKLASTNI